MALRAIVRKVSPAIKNCELTYLERVPIDYSLAQMQHEAYCITLGKAGFQVEQLVEDASSPDSVFVEDPAIVLDEIALVTTMGTDFRRNETASVARALSRYREIVHAALPATLEGGDVLQIGRKIFVGRSCRTNEAGIHCLSKALKPFDYQIIPVDVRGCLHLKTGVTALDEQTVLINSEWVEATAFSTYDQIEVPREEPWAANVIAASNGVIAHSGNERTCCLLTGHGYRLLTIDISEFMKAEAGLTCLSLRFAA